MGALKNRFRKIPLIGEVLVEMGLIKQEQLDAALKKSNTTGQRIGSILVNDGYVRDVDFYKALAKQHGLPYMDLRGVEVDKKAAQSIPQSVAVQLAALPIRFQDGKLLVAIHDPANLNELTRLAERLNIEVDAVVAKESSIRLQLGNLYRRLRPVGDDSGSTLGETETTVDQILRMAVNHQASDIHIEPQEGSLQIRERIDGVLEKSMEINMDFHSAIVSRLKILAGLDIAEKRNPQDGRIIFSVDGRDIDIRMSTLPTIRGEKVVLRILDKSNSKIGLHQLGLDKEKADAVKGLLAHPHGIILVSGPTGSGKTTTVYSMLLEINSIDKNIITIEDPVEYKFDIINQVQVNHKAGLTFPKLLRNILRQDPDIIMVGEIRDKETADIAIRSALTGHLVISTIHTNDAASAVTRLIDMGIDPFLISASVVGVVAQRLVRKICPTCETKGCDDCHKSGYLGREGIYEILDFDKGLRKLIKADISVDAIQEYLKGRAFKTMRDDGIRKVSDGVTTMEEVLRVTTEAE